MALLFLLLYLLSINAPVRVEDEGIEITFGNADDGGGMPNMAPLMPQPQAEADPAPATPSRPSDNDLMVQEDDEDLLALAKQREEDAKRKAAEEELIRQQREEVARIEAERQAREKALAEKRAREQEAIARAQQAMAGFGQTTSAVGANGDNASTAEASGVKGNPVGKGFGMDGAHSWKLQGRDIVGGIPRPSTEFGNKEGKVVVRIWVDANGNVTNVKAIGGEGTADPILKRLAEEAAKKAKFSKGDLPQIGEITYIFKLK